VTFAVEFVRHRKPRRENAGSRFIEPDNLVSQASSRRRDFWFRRGNHGASPFGHCPRQDWYAGEVKGIGSGERRSCRKGAAFFLFAVALEGLPTTKLGQARPGVRAGRLVCWVLICGMSPGRPHPGVVACLLVAFGPRGGRSGLDLRGPSLE